MATEIFYIADENGKFIYNNVFLSKIIAKIIASDMKFYSGKNYYVESKTLPFVEEYVFRVKIYYGYDDLSNYKRLCDIEDSISISPLYSSIEDAKSFGLWQVAEAKANLDKDNYNFYPLKICSKGDGDKDFFFGSVSKGKFSAEIECFEVDKRI